MRRKNQPGRLSPRDKLSLTEGVVRGLAGGTAGVGLLAMLFGGIGSGNETRRYEDVPAVEASAGNLIRPDFSYAAKEITADIGKAVDCAPKSSFWNSVGRMTGAYRPGGDAIHGPDGDKAPFMIFGETSAESSSDGYLPLSKGWVVAYNEPSDSYDLYSFHTQDVRIRLKSQLNDIPVESTVVAPYIVGAHESTFSRQELVDQGGKTFSAFGMTLSLNPPANEQQRVISFSFGCG